MVCLPFIFPRHGEKRSAEMQCGMRIIEEAYVMQKLKNSEMFYRGTDTNRLSVTDKRF